MPKRVREDKLNEIRAPMSGLVRSVFCSENEIVSEGQELLIVGE